MLDCLLVIKPATLVGWHRQIVRRHWTFLARRRPGSPGTAPKTEQLALRRAREKANLGCGKIAGEIGDRRIVFWNISDAPDGPWTTRQSCKAEAR